MDASQNVSELVNGEAKGSKKGSHELAQKRKNQHFDEYKIKEANRIKDMREQGKKKQDESEAKKKKELDDFKEYKKKQQKKIAEIKEGKLQDEIQEHNREGKRHEVHGEVADVVADPVEEVSEEVQEDSAQGADDSEVFLPEVDAVKPE